MFPYVTSRLALVTLLGFSGDDSDGGVVVAVVDYKWGLCETSSLNPRALESYSVISKHHSQFTFHLK